MKVAGFMVPAEEAITASPYDSILSVMRLMLQHKIGSVVIVRNEETREGSDICIYQRACGIITKSDILAAYKNTHIGIDYPCHLIMTHQHNLATCTPEMSRGQAAQILEQNHNHHAIVVDDEQHKRFVGILSSWDIAAECARDKRAWPWNRAEDGKFHNFHGDSQKHVTAKEHYQALSTEKGKDIAHFIIPPGDPLADPRSPTSPKCIKSQMEGSFPATLSNEDMDFLLRLKQAP
mmetsp:Transcript_602/g.1163  ORF Transcript_602/g.1163 Transcript_602/m.1163 type:complete len:235 (+) Transcript_602:1060-1764(+)|eukprot:scaffold43364_cov290-Amphora_coffeaeformis.AAC.1